MALKVGYKHLLNEANRQIKAVSVQAAAVLIHDDDIVFVDIRDIRELQRTGMIPGAFHAPRGMLEFWVDPDCKYHKEIFSSGKTFVFYCNSGWRSALATKSLQDMGMESVSHLSGGFEAWRAAELPREPRETKRA